MAHQRGVDRGDCLRALAAAPAALHRRPVSGYRHVEIGIHGRPDRGGGVRGQSRRQAEQSCGGTGLVGDGLLGLVQRFPDHQHREGEQHGVYHADRGELEAGHFIVGAKPLQRNEAANRQNPEHGQNAARQQQQQGVEPDRGCREQGHAGALSGSCSTGDRCVASSPTETLGTAEVGVATSRAARPDRDGRRPRPRPCRRRQR